LGDNSKSAARFIHSKADANSGEMLAVCLKGNSRGLAMRDESDNNINAASTENRF
jgi:hypothetical protein